MNKPTPTQENVKKEAPLPPKTEKPQEIGGRGGLDPIRYGDWEIGGKCVDF